MRVIKVLLTVIVSLEYEIIKIIYISILSAVINARQMYYYYSTLILNSVSLICLMHKLKLYVTTLK
jgi:hypothetical protein